MPRTQLILFRERDGSVPLIQWLDDMQQKPRIKCLAALARLNELGYELRRPEADILRDGIYELRVRLRGVNYRMLYFFVGQQAVVVSHGFTKESEVPPVEIDRAVRRRQAFIQSPSQHTAEGPLP